MRHTTRLPFRPLPGPFRGIACTGFSFRGESSALASVDAEARSLPVAGPAVILGSVDAVTLGSRARLERRQVPPGVEPDTGSHRAADPARGAEAAASCATPSGDLAAGSAAASPGGAVATTGDAAAPTRPVAMVPSSGGAARGSPEKDSSNITRKTREEKFSGMSTTATPRLAATSSPERTSTKAAAPRNATFAAMASVLE